MERETGGIIGAAEGKVDAAEHGVVTFAFTTVKVAVIGCRHALAMSMLEAECGRQSFIIGC
jgi:hypothetical protein